MDWPQYQKITILDVKNPSYCEKDNILANALYRGGSAFEVIKNELLYTRTQDENPKYRKSRLQVAEYENHIAGMYDYSRAIAFQATPRLVFTGPDKLLTYYNRLNDGLRELMEGRYNDMQLYGYSLFTVSYPGAPLAALNFKQQLEPGGALDAWLAYLCPSTVQDWGCDLLGRLQWVKTHTCECSRSLEYGAVDAELHTWTYISAVEKVVYQATRMTDKKSWAEKDEAKLLSVTPISFGLPVLEASLVNRNCIMERVKRPAVGLFNTESNWKFAVASQCFAQAWYAGPTEAKDFFNKLGENVVLFLGQGGQFGYAVPEGVNFETQEQIVAAQKANLDALINAEFKNQDKDMHAASGVVKQEERLPAAISAEAYARPLVAALMRAVQYIIDSRKDTGIVTARMEGMNNFSPLAIQDKIAAVAAYKLIPGAAPTALKIVQRDLDHAMTPGATPEESAAIDTENTDIEAPASGAESGAESSAASAASSGATSAAASSTCAAMTMSANQTLSSASNAGAPDTGPNITIQAKLKKIDPKRVQPQHDTDKSFVASLKKKIGAQGYNPKFPALVVEIPGMHDDGGSIYKSLDAHHRIEASKELNLNTIPAYVLSYADWTKLTAAFPFDPKKLGSLDSHIELPDGRTYNQVRTDNSHSNNASSGVMSQAQSQVLTAAGSN